MLSYLCVRLIVHKCSKRVLTPVMIFFICSVTVSIFDRQTDRQRRKFTQSRQRQTDTYSNTDRYSYSDTDRQTDRDRYSDRQTGVVIHTDRQTETVIQT